MLVAVGCDPALASERIEVTTGSSVEFASRVAVKSIKALGQLRADFGVLAHTLPPSAGIDGVLGLDFMRGQKLVLDFRSGEMTLL
jgi:hypothetical protein